MKHCILGWGSLPWDPGSHPLALATDWQKGGPALPIEFSRVSTSRGGALTLVIDPEHGAEVPTYYAASARDSLDETIVDLRCREATIDRRIGFVDLLTGSHRCDVLPEVADRVRAWAERHEFSSVVWTDLPPNFHREGRGPFNVQGAMAYLQRLPGRGAQLAKEYISLAPPEVVTPLRTAVEEAVWWPSYGQDQDR